MKCGKIQYHFLDCRLYETVPGVSQHLKDYETLI